MAEGLPQRAAGQRRKRRAIAQPVPEEATQEPDGRGAEQTAAAEAVTVQNGLADDRPTGPTAPEPAQLDALRSQAAAGHNFEYLDHTADVQLHAWGKSLDEAFANVALAMYNYMVPLEEFADAELESREFSAEAHDAESLLFKFLDELLFSFLTELFVCTEVTVSSLDKSAWSITAKGRGATFDRGKHLAGTEVKAITYSAMQIVEREGDAEVFVIVDI